MTDTGAIVAAAVDGRCRLEEAFAAKVEAVDARAAAVRIAAGRRAAMQAATADVVAVARRAVTLEAFAGSAFGLLAAIDALHDDPGANRAAQVLAVRDLIDQVAVTLEALGYGGPQ